MLGPAADENILLPSAPKVSVTSAIAALRSGAFQTSPVPDSVIIALPSAQRMSVSAQQATTPSTRSGAFAASASE